MSGRFTLIVIDARDADRGELIADAIGFAHIAGVAAAGWPDAYACTHTVVSESEPGARSTLWDLLMAAKVPGDDALSHLSVWDACEHPLAVLHLTTPTP